MHQALAAALDQAFAEIKRIQDDARTNGFTLLTATTLWENRPARALLRRLGFRARASHGTEIELELELARPTITQPASNPRPPK